MEESAMLGSAANARRAIGVLVLLAAWTGVAGAQDSEARSAREREMLHRTQEALRQSQSENNDLARAKQDAEQKLKASAEELEKAGRASKSALSAQTALRAQLKTAADAQSDLAGKLEVANQQLAAVNQKQRETASELSARESQLKQLQQDLETAKASGAACEAKNLKLYEYSQALLERYHRKGVWDALAQKDPVLGIKEVGVENVVQEYHEKFETQKVAQKAAP
jgi:chromosome segregation ATPase